MVACVNNNLCAILRCRVAFDRRVAQYIGRIVYSSERGRNTRESDAA